METRLLKGKHAFVFGAKGALGKQVAAVFAGNGANVYLSDINVVGISEPSEWGEIRKVDTLDEQQVEAYFQEFAQAKLPVDIVVNLSSSNHAEFRHGEPTTTVSMEQFSIPFRTHTVSQFITAKAAFAVMSEQQKGTILFITSTLAKVGAPFTAALTASHAATEGLVKSLASEWGASSVRVLGVRSGAMFDTPTIAYTFETIGKNMGLTREQVMGYVAGQKTALKRMPSAVETAKVLLLAASDMAGYMTGTILNNSGGEILE